MINLIDGEAKPSFYEINKLIYEQVDVRGSEAGLLPGTNHSEEMETFIDTFTKFSS